MGWDVVIVGAGTAGAAAARQCARAGLKTLCLDRAPLDGAGAHWVNGVAAAAFLDSGIPAPRPPERLGHDGGDFHLLVGWGPDRLTVRSPAVLEVDMRLLSARLRADAEAAGAEFRGDTRVLGLTAGGLRTEAEELAAAVVVDASGMTGARLLGQGKVDGRHVCAAAQQVRQVADPQAARAFFEQHRVAVGDVACFTGVAGGYSIVNVKLDGDRVALLTGSVPADGPPPGNRLLDSFVAEQPWIGHELFGGARAIPIRRPRDVLATGRVALLGDSGCQVFPAHGSGIGGQLVAATMLAEDLAAGRSPWQWSVRWMRQHGGRFAAYDVFRRFSQDLTTEELRELVTAGLLDEAGSRAGLEQKWPKASVGSLPRQAVALASRPGLALRLAPVGAKMAAVAALYARYPSDPDEVPRWGRAVARVFGEPPDAPPVEQRVD